ncbi:hypothetical protein DER45DRAFT_636565 [Fusarium avenaceum]|nr:hypothetical protein DER45DRAFT_636565 [Fusarium avenaceum]
MERQVLIKPGLGNVITDENEYLLSGAEEPDQYGSLNNYQDTQTREVLVSTPKRMSFSNGILLEAETEVAWLTSPRAQELNSEQNNTTNQNYDINTFTRLQCVVEVFIGGLLALACIGSGIYVLATKKEKLALHVNVDIMAIEVLSLVFNIILTFCIDSMAFTHSVSLRWALYGEHKLEFNTNLRLSTNSTKIGPNRWYTNIFGMICLTFCYGASSYLLLPYLVNEIFINSLALLIPGLALLGHAALSTWCLWTSSKSILTLDSNALSNCIATVQIGMFERRSGRCMRSVHDRKPASLQLCADVDTQPILPRQKQENMYKLTRRIRRIIWLLWTLAVLAIASMFAIIGLNLAYTADSGEYCPLSTASLKWDMLGSGGCNSNKASLSMSPLGQNPEDWNKYPLLQVFLGLLFLNENVWWNAYSNSSKTRKEYIILSLFRSVLHWSVGQAVQPGFQFDIPDEHSTTDPSLLVQEMAVAGVTFYMVYPRLLLYAVLARSGPQPATWV